MWLMWVVIALTVAMIVGPIMMVRPTPGISRIARIRTAASQLGLIVRLESVREGSSKVQHAVYSLPRHKESDEQEHAPVWVLERKPYSHELHFSGTWDWRGSGKAPTRQHVILKEIVSGLHSDFYALTSSSAGFGCEWNEACRGRSEKEAAEYVKNMLIDIAARIETGSTQK